MFDTYQNNVGRRCPHDLPVSNDWDEKQKKDNKSDHNELHDERERNCSAKSLFFKIANIPS